jgi:hypothetical protein
MKGLAGGLAISLACAAPLAAQERDRSLERIGLALQQPPQIVRDGIPVESNFPKKLGFVTLVQPTKRGEMIRISIPIGEFIVRAVTGVAAANHRRQQAAAHRKVEAEIKAFMAQKK